MSVLHTKPKCGELSLEVYIAGHTPAGERAIRNLNKLCAEICADGDFEIVAINILENPQAAEEQKILATPTVIRRSPPPVRIMIGDMEDREEVIFGLNLLVA